MPGNSVYRKPNQLGWKERIGQKRRRPAITDHHALHLCARASSQVIRSLATSVSRAMSEGGRSYLDRQPDVNKRSLVAAIEPGLRLVESIRSRYLDQVQGRVCRTKATSSPMNPLCVNPTHFGLIDDRIVFVAPVERLAPFDAVLSTLFAEQEGHTQDKYIKTTKSREPAPRALIRQISCWAEGIFQVLSG
jgi:hypothetical protein